MFVRIKRTPNSSKTAVQLVENVREGGKVKQKIIRHFGYAENEEELKALKKLALHYKLELELNEQPSVYSKEVLLDIIDQGIEYKEKIEKEREEIIVNLTNLREEKRLSVGIHRAYGLIYKDIGYEGVLDYPKRRKRSEEMLFNMVMARISKPASKRSSVDMIEQEYGIRYNLNSIYRMMDYINDSAIKRIKDKSYKYIKGIFSEDINVIFYDCTTLYFESFQEDELKQKGYSKDQKHNQSQVLLAVMVTEYGLPIGYEVFEGSCFEGHTLKDALDLLRNRYKIKRVVFVADSAILSRENMEYLRENNQDFIVGARIRNVKKEIKEKILDKSRYQPIDLIGERELLYQEIGLDDGMKMIVTYSSVRAEKDRYEREKSIESLQKRLEKSNTILGVLSNYGYKKFIEVEGENKLKINEEKIKEEEKWDGLHGIITNIKDRNIKDILSVYHDLWQVEETFRITKHDLEIRPIFHWTPRRIRAHIAICFMALVCIRVMEYRVRLQYKKMSPMAIKKSLLSVEVSILKDIKTKKRYVLPSQITQDAKKIFQILGIKYSETPYELR